MIPDQRLERHARLLTYVTALVRAGDRVAIIGPTPAVPLLPEL
jgi:leucyl aminopeptidase (aminopeptidase T)